MIAIYVLFSQQWELVRLEYSVQVATVADKRNRDNANPILTKRLCLGLLHPRHNVVA